MSKTDRILLIVESNAKAKTISKILPGNFIVRASFGHVMELPKNKLGFNPDDNYKPSYSVSSSKVKIVRELKSIAKGVDRIILASDHDREGEVIAWSLANLLKLDLKKAERIVFHEITKTAILNALNNPGHIDLGMVDAGIARRILDRAVGYTLSPLLWKKIKYGLSVGRVQSPALRILTDREDEINNFKPEEFWKFKLDILSDPKFRADLAKIDGKKFKVTNKEDADAIKQECDNSTYILSNIEEKESFRNPPPPFTTSTMQQEAARKAGMSVKNTMSVAQRLYDGSIKIPGVDGGLITYMRTDSVNMSNEAINMVNELILLEYGQDYSIPTPRRYGNSKNAQEAHECIRPTKLKLKPSDIKEYLDPKEYKLYSLIWKRTMATQMAKAKVANTIYSITCKDGKYEFIAKGTKVLFPGFMKAYTEGNDDGKASDNAEKFLPIVAKGTVFKDTKLTTEQNFTTPPPRYTEASLVKKLEALGIGRPSTYATTIDTIIAREYVARTPDKKLQPTVIGSVVIGYLKSNFPKIVDFDFTANMEADLDKVATGDLIWYKMMDGFYHELVELVKSKAGDERVQYSDAKVLGKHPETNEEIVIKTGQYGVYVQQGEKSEDKSIKPRIASVPKGIGKEEVTLEQALHLLTLPKVLGKKDDKDIKVSIGRFGPMLQWNSKYYTIKQPDDPYTITLDRSLEIMKEKDEADAKAILLEFPDDNIKVINGRYGPYIQESDPKVKGKKGRKFYKVSKDLTEDKIRNMSLKDIKEIMKNQPNKNKGRYKGSKRKEK